MALLGADGDRLAVGLIDETRSAAGQSRESTGAIGEDEANRSGAAHRSAFLDGIRSDSAIGPS